MTLKFNFILFYKKCSQISLISKDMINMIPKVHFMWFWYRSCMTEHHYTIQNGGYQMQEMLTHRLTDSTSLPQTWEKFLHTVYLCLYQYYTCGWNFSHVWGKHVNFDKMCYTISLISWPPFWIVSCWSVMHDTHQNHVKWMIFICFNECYLKVGIKNLFA